MRRSKCPLPQTVLCVILEALSGTILAIQRCSRALCGQYHRLSYSTQWSACLKFCRPPVAVFMSVQFLDKQVTVLTIYRYNPVASFPFGGGSWGNSQAPLEVATPAVLPQPPLKGLEGHHKTGNLAMFLNNRGEVTAYTSSGHKLWQARLQLSMASLLSASKSMSQHELFVWS